MGTPAADQFEDVLSERFPGIRFGRVNCRKISNSAFWSQHSWNNARDVYPPLGITYLRSNDGDYRAYLDEVWAFIKANQDMLNIRVKLWQVTNHYNHIHVDFWPRGWATPPCAGGSNRYKYPGGDTRVGPPVLLNEYEERTMNLHALVRAAFTAGNPAVAGDIDYWLQLADNDPFSDEWENLFRAMLTPVVSAAGIQYGALVRLEEH